MTLALQLTIRLLAAGVAGTVIGFEREIRSKEAGIRTHVLVALGSCLFMLVSQYGFPGSERFDAARVAAGVVVGLGFLGGGIIMKNKHVTGLTTAAGLWVTSAIGLAIGGGMYELGIVCTVLVLVCMELLSFYSLRLGDKEVLAVLSTHDEQALLDAVEQLGKEVKRCSLSKQGDLYKAGLTLSIKKKEPVLKLLPRLSSLPGVTLESLDE